MEVRVGSQYSGSTIYLSRYRVSASGMDAREEEEWELKREAMEHEEVARKHGRHDFYPIFVLF